MLEFSCTKQDYAPFERKPFARQLRYISRMKTLTQVFTEHPASVGETWSEHAGTAFGFCWRLQLAALAALVHAVFPFLCVKTASTLITTLQTRMVTHRRMPQVPGTSKTQEV